MPSRSPQATLLAILCADDRTGCGNTAPHQSGSGEGWRRSPSQQPMEEGDWTAMVRNIRTACPNEATTSEGQDMARCLCRSLMYIVALRSEQSHSFSSMCILGVSTYQGSLPGHCPSRTTTTIILPFLHPICPTPQLPHQFLSGTPSAAGTAPRRPCTSPSTASSLPDPCSDAPPCRACSSDP